MLCPLHLQVQNALSSPGARARQEAPAPASGAGQTRAPGLALCVMCTAFWGQRQPPPSSPGGMWPTRGLHRSLSTAAPGTGAVGGGAMMAMMTMPTRAWLSLGQAHKRRWQGPRSPVPSVMGQRHHPACPCLRRQCKACPAVPQAAPSADSCACSRPRTRVCTEGAGNSTRPCRKVMRAALKGRGEQPAGRARENQLLSGLRGNLFHRSGAQDGERQLGLSERLRAVPSRGAGMAPGDRRPHSPARSPELPVCRCTCPEGCG